MNKPEGIKYYSVAEERLNVLSHALGFILSLIGLFLLVTHALQLGNTWHLISFSVFGISLLLLYAASTLYHNTQEPVLRKRLKIFDHAAIYVVIAGTYTPFSLVTLQGNLGWIIFGVIWGLALAGVILKLFFTGKFKLLSTIMYVVMGWVIIFAFNPLYKALPYEGIQWLVAGGIAYTLGAVLYSIEKIKFNHAIFHLFVLLGSFCHFMAIYLYV